MGYKESGIEISIHAPRAGRDQFFSSFAEISKKFQSTRPVRGATMIWDSWDSSNEFQSTRPVRGATWTLSVTKSASVPLFQSTRPVRGATHSGGISGSTGIFQSTRPVRGATLSMEQISPMTLHFNPRAPCGARLAESMHSPYFHHNFNPRAPCGARQQQEDLGGFDLYFNPRAPCGARQFGFSVFLSADTFQSTRPVRGATSTIRR